MDNITRMDFVGVNVIDLVLSLGFYDVTPTLMRVIYFEQCVQLLKSLNRD